MCVTHYKGISFLVLMCWRINIKICNSSRKEDNGLKISVHWLKAFKKKMFSIQQF